MSVNITTRDYLENLTTTTYSKYFYSRSASGNWIKQIELGPLTAIMIISMPIGYPSYSKKGPLPRGLLFVNELPMNSIPYFASAIIDFNWSGNIPFIATNGAFKYSVNVFGQTGDFNFGDGFQFSNMITCNKSQNFYAADGGGHWCEDTGYCIAKYTEIILIAQLPTAENYLFGNAKDIPISFQCGIPEFMSSDMYNNNNWLGKVFKDCSTIDYFSDIILDKTGYLLSLDYCKNCNDNFLQSFTDVCSKDTTRFNRPFCDFSYKDCTSFNNCRDYNWVKPVYDSLDADDPRRATIPKLQDAAITYNNICTIEQNDQ